MLMRNSLYDGSSHGHASIPFVFNGTGLCYLAGAPISDMVQMGIAYLFGARFDVAIDQLKQGKYSRQEPHVAREIIDKDDKGEL